MLPDKINTTCRCLEEILNSSQPLKRENVKAGESLYYFLKPQIGKDNESLAEMNVRDVSKGMSPAVFKASAYQVPIETQQQAAHILASLFPPDVPLQPYVFEWLAALRARTEEKLNQENLFFRD